MGKVLILYVKCVCYRYRKGILFLCMYWIWIMLGLVCLGGVLKFLGKRDEVVLFEWTVKIQIVTGVFTVRFDCWVNRGFYFQI